MSLYVSESYVDKQQNAFYGESGIYEAFTDDLGKLYKSCQREFGRCVSYLYTDTPDGSKRNGWVFVKRVPYEDTPNQTYLREVWVSLHDAPPSVVTTYHPHCF